MLSGKKIFLRYPKLYDSKLLLKWENDRSIWDAGTTRSLFTKTEIENFISESEKDIYSTKQLRKMICTQPSEKKNSVPVGCIDLFEFDDKNRRAGIGILISEKKHRKKGYASEALNIMTTYCFKILFLHQLYCNISEINKDSLNLFKRHGFKITGTKKQWFLNGKKNMNLHQLQLIYKG